MEAIVYHEIDPSTLDTVLRDGVKRTMHSDKISDTLIRKTDAFLDTHRDKHAQNIDMQRAEITYAYIGNKDRLIDITTGQEIRVADFVAKTGKTLVQMKVDPTRCFVSDLDLYDTIKRSMQLNEQASTRENLAATYWDKLVRLDMFSPDMIKRPEVLITYDVPASAISSAISRSSHE